jgi:hypothetical protein
MKKRWIWTQNRTFLVLYRPHAPQQPALASLRPWHLLKHQTFTSHGTPYAVVVGDPLLPFVRPSPSLPFVCVQGHTVHCTVLPTAPPTCGTTAHRRACLSLALPLNRPLYPPLVDIGAYGYAPPAMTQPTPLAPQSALLSPCSRPSSTQYTLPPAPPPCGCGTTAQRATLPA